MHSRSSGYDKVTEPMAPSMISSRDFRIFLGFAAKEVVNPTIYVLAAVIGSIICFFTRNWSFVPFIVPVFVQIIARSNVAFRNRHVSALVALPAKKEDPVFIMDMFGEVVLSTGNTLELFQGLSIRNIRELIGQRSLNRLLAMIAGDDPAQGASEHSIEAYSVTTGKWYEIKARTAGEVVLVWFQDISLRKAYDERLRDLLRYSDSLIFSLRDLVVSGSVYEHLASFLLDDYGAVFITRTDEDKNLVGQVFKKSADTIQRSETIIIPKDSLAPINISRQKAEIITDEMEGYASKEEFLKHNPLDPRVLEFIHNPIRNFITYNAADVSIIAFNFKSAITPYEKSFFEILLNNYRTMVALVDREQARRSS